MIADADLDRFLVTWLSEGPEVAPADDIAAALDTVVRTPQRRWRGGLSRRWRHGGSQRLGILVAAAALALAAISVAALIGGQLRVQPAPTTFPEPMLTPTPNLSGLRRVDISDWSVELAIPASWSELSRRVVGEYHHFGGVEPEGHLSASHESPFAVTVCDPDCEEITVTATIPYSADAQLGALKDAVGERLGRPAWGALRPGLLPEVVNAARAESVVLIDGTEWRRVNIVGLRDRNLVAIAWAQPVDAYDGSLLDHVLSAMTLPSAPRYSDGDLAASRQDAFEIQVPGVWDTTEQPRLDDVPLSGVVRFGEGEIVVSIGDPDGTLGWCDPDCRVVKAQTSLETLARSLRGDAAPGTTEQVTLDGEPALAFEAQDATGNGPLRRYVVAIHERRPVAVMVDPRAWDVAPGIVDTMLASFRFIDPLVATPTQTFTVGAGRVQLKLGPDWRQEADNGSLAFGRAQTLDVRVGNSAGTITTCGKAAAPWELCHEVQVRTLDDLADAVDPAPIADHGIGPPQGTRTNHVVGGEAGFVTRIAAYEHPARSGQEVVYIGAFHDGLPYLVRIWTSANEVRDLDSVVAGLTFIDRPAEPATFSLGDGRVRLTLTSDWHEQPDGSLLLPPGQTLSVHVGDASGTIQTCAVKAGDWERCRKVHVRTLAELADAVHPIALDHVLVVRTPDWLMSQTLGQTLGGEPKFVTQLEDVRSGRGVVYIGAMHGGRPYLVRVSGVAVSDLASVFAGFEFVN